MIDNGKPQEVVLASGQTCVGHVMPIEQAVMFEDIPATELVYARDATHVLTVRYREDIGVDDVVTVEGIAWQVLRVFDPFAGDDAVIRHGTVVIGSKENSQARKWTKVLVKRG